MISNSKPGQHNPAHNQVLIYCIVQHIPASFGVSRPPAPPPVAQKNLKRDGIANFYYISVGLRTIRTSPDTAMPGYNFLDELSHENISMITQNRALGPQATEALSNVCAGFRRSHAHDKLDSDIKKIMSQSVAREFSQIVNDLKTLQDGALRQEVIMLTLLHCDRDLYVHPDFVDVVARMMRKYSNTEQIQTCGCRLLCLKNQQADARFFTAEYDVICNALNAFNRIPRLALWALRSLALNSAAFKIANNEDATNPVNDINNSTLRIVFVSRRGGLTKILASVIRCIEAQNSPDMSEERIKIVKYGCQILADLANPVTFVRVRTLCQAESKARQIAIPGSELKVDNSSVVAGMDRCLLQVIVNTQVHRAAAFLHDFDSILTQIDTMATNILILMIKANALSDTNNIMGDIPATNVVGDAAAGASKKAKHPVNVISTPAAAGYGRRQEANDLLSLALKNVSRDRYSAGGRLKATTLPRPAAVIQLPSPAIEVPKPRPPKSTFNAVPATVLPVDPVGIIPRLILAGNTSKFRILTEYCNMPGCHLLWKRYATYVPSILTKLRQVCTTREKFDCIPSLEFLEGFTRNNSDHQALMVRYGAHVVLRDLLYSTPRNTLPRNTVLDLQMMPNPEAEQQRIHALIAQDAVIAQIHEGVFFALTNFVSSPMTVEFNAQMIDCFMPEILQSLAHLDGDHTIPPGQDTVRMRQHLRKNLYAGYSSVKNVVCSLRMLCWMFSNDEVSDAMYRKYLMKDVLACCARYPDNAVLAQAAFSLFYQMGLQHQFFFNIEESVVLAVDSMKKNETNPALMAACIRFLHAISQTQQYDIAVQQDFLQTYFLRLRKLAAPGNTPDVTRMLHEICDKLVFFDAQHQHLSGQDQPIVF